MGKRLKFPSPVTNAQRSGQFNTIAQTIGLRQDIGIGMDQINCSWLEVAGLNARQDCLLNLGIISVGCQWQVTALDPDTGSY
jgi:hypothetical protein